MPRRRRREQTLERVLGTPALFATAYGNVGSSIYYALGVTAARSLTGKTVTIAKMRRTPVELADGTKLVVTIHPSALLRIEDENDKHAAYRDFVADLKAARAAAGKAPR